jgi:hypothetical protein
MTAILGLFGLVVFIKVKPGWAAIAAVLGLGILIVVPYLQLYDVQIVVVPK